MKDPVEGLVWGVVRTMRPFVRRLVAAGVPYGRIAEAVRRLYVEVAEEASTGARRPTDSHISLVTGLNRKEVRRLRSADPDLGMPGTFSRNHAASIVSRWLSDRRLLTATGRPRILPYESSRGPSFVRLARGVTRDLPPRAILDELARTGTVEIRGNDRIALLADAYLPLSGSPEKLAMVADDPPELIETMLHNVFADGAARFQRKVAYDHIGSKALDTLRDRLSREATRFIASLDRILSRFDRDRNPEAPDGKRVYAGMGVYYFEDFPEKDGSRPVKGRGPRGER